MNVRVYETLPPEGAVIRQKVFIEEQGFQSELDETDARATHLVMFDGETPVAVCRFFTADVTGDYTIGRLAVVKQYREQNIGSAILKAAESEIAKRGGTRIRLHSQYQVRKFYEKSGYRQCGAIDYDESCPHVWMEKEISGASNDK